MKPIEFKEHNIVFAKNQPEYLPLPAYRTKSGVVYHCWSLSLREKIVLLLTGKLWIAVATFNTSPQPIKPLVDTPVFDKDKK